MANMIETTREIYQDGELIHTETVLVEDPAPLFAKQKLKDNDDVATRCVKAGVAYPAEWKAYDVALRAVVNSGSGPLPDQPAYPQGT